MIGLTGGIASGKSTVARFLEDLGAKVLDADKIAREVVQPGLPAWQKIKDLFPEVIGRDELIDRRKLGRIVFNDLRLRRKLEEIIHPEVISLIRRQGNELEKKGEIVIADIPLLFETNLENWLNPVWLVYVDKVTQLNRLMRRDALDYDQAMKRIEAQMPLEEKRKLANEVIDNSGTIEYTHQQVEQLWRKYLNENCLNRSR